MHWLSHTYAHIQAHNNTCRRKPQHNNTYRHTTENTNTHAQALTDAHIYTHKPTLTYGHELTHTYENMLTHKHTHTEAGAKEHTHIGSDWRTHVSHTGAGAKASGKAEVCADKENAGNSAVAISGTPSKPKAEKKARKLFNAVLMPVIYICICMVMYVYIYIHVRVVQGGSHVEYIYICIYTCAHSFEYTCAHSFEISTHWAHIYAFKYLPCLHIHFLSCSVDTYSHRSSVSPPFPTSLSLLP